MSDDQPQLSDSIPVVLDQFRETAGHLLRLIRPTKAALIDQLVAELSRQLERVAELTIAQAEHRAAAAVEPMIDDVQELKQRIAALDQPDGPEQAREVGGG